MYSFEGRIRYSETDSEGRLTMAALLNYFQDCSTFQSEDLGLGVAFLKEHHRVWVLSSWQIVVDRYPVLCEKVVVGTFPYEFKGFLGFRNFVMKTPEGEILARANSLWSLLDTETGKPAVPDALSLERYVPEEKLEMEYAPRKVAIPKGGSFAESITVKKHHLDTNYHVNNGQFVDIAMELLPRDFIIGQLRAEYKKQAFLGDVFYPYEVEAGDRIVVSLQDAQGKPYMSAEFQRKEK